MKRFFRNIPEIVKATNHKITYNYVDTVPKFLRKEIDKMKTHPMEIPNIIGGEKRRSKMFAEQYCPYDHQKVIAKYGIADREDLEDAIEESMRGGNIWRNISDRDKCDIFLKAADLVCGKYRNKLLAATIVGQGKNVYQAEIDAICELADFLRFNVQYFGELQNELLISNITEKNCNYWGHLNGYVGAISPFNFTAIGGNLMTAPLLMGNPVIWKSSDYSKLSNYLFYKIMCEAGMPPEAVQFVSCEPGLYMDTITDNRHLGGIVFTGSSNVFDNVIKQTVNNISLYNNYPRIVGETGGHNYHFIFPDENMDMDLVVERTIRGAFEFAGQKCSATGRVYIPKSLYKEFMDIFEKKMSELVVGSPEEDFNFMSAVIHRRSYDVCEKVIKDNDDYILYGGETDDSKGYYINPTMIEVKDLNDEKLKREVFGPVLMAYVYDDSRTLDIEMVFRSCVSVSPYKLTGAIFYEDRRWDELIKRIGSYSVGNFYINDKSTGSVVGNQPFGGFGKSGTNDKAGSKYFLTRFANMIVHKKSYKYV